MSLLTCLKGAAKYLMGERASVPTQHARAVHCATCPNRRIYREDAVKGCAAWASILYPVPLVAWCGEPGNDRGVDGCGCPVLGQVADGQTPHVVLTVGGEEIGFRAMGKTEVLSETCPRGLW